MKEVLQLANDFVNQVEDKGLATLYQENLVAKAHAEGCGCRSCVGHAQRAKDRFDNEIWRIYGAPNENEEAPTIKEIFTNYLNLGDIED